MENMQLNAHHVPPVPPLPLPMGRERERERERHRGWERNIKAIIMYT